MAQAKRDENRVTVALATSSDDGVTPLNITANPDTGVLQTDDNTTGNPASSSIATRDQNGVTVLMAVSSVDGETLVPIQIDPATNKLLIDST